MTPCTLFSVLKLIAGPSLQESLPQFRDLEQKIETLNEFVQV